jgi:hypothetical protein
MDGGGGGTGKLTRTPSSLLRSPTVRAASSFHAFDDPEPDDKKALALLRQAHYRLRPGLALLLLALAVLLLRQGGGLYPALLAAAAVSALFAVARLRRTRHRRKPALAEASVQWFIGDDGDGEQRNQAAAVREGVEFYSNGDCYEGEFHGGRCSGSGVYNFFGKGKYEGDWVDGKYDGYGVESCARGSRYRGRYRLGLRHGHGVYRFYSGDCYAGEWAAGQSNGIGAQTCSDGSSYAGEFKAGVKHGPGCYHFR